jgi:uncharacterized protein with HEPN domain
MPRTALKYFFDIARACERLQAFLSAKSREDYLQDLLLQAAVERQFEIIGEATAQLAKLDVGAVDRIPEYRRLIAFRNVLIHGYADVDHEIVWDLAQTRVAALEQVARAALAEDPPQ